MERPGLAVVVRGRWSVEITTQTNSLVTDVLAAHGGLERWRRFRTVTATVITGGFLWAMKGIPIEDAPRSMTSEFRRQWTRTEPSAPRIGT